MRRHIVAAAIALAAVLGGEGVAYADPTPTPTPSTAPTASPTPTPTPSPTAPFRARDTSGDNPFLNVPGVGNARTIDRLLQAAVDEVCTRPPMPQAPTDPIAGAIDPGPSTPAPGTLYGDRGYGGFQLPIYDPGCIPGLKSMQKRIFDGPNTLATGLFGIGMVEVAVLAVMARYVLDVADVWGILDGAVATTHGTIAAPLLTNPVFVFGAVMLVAITLAWRQRRHADVPGTAKHSVVAVVILAGALLTAANSWIIGPTYDAGARAVFTSISSVSTAGQEGKTADVAVADTLLRGPVFSMWAQSLLGNDPAAIEKYGWRLHAAGSYTREEAEQAAASPQARREWISRKQADYRAVAAELKHEYPAAYENLSGTETTRRVGPAFLLLLLVTTIGAPLFASLAAIAAAKVVIRAALAAYPLGALAWMQPSLQEHLVKMGRIVWAFTKAAFGGVLVFVTTMVVVVGIAVNPATSFGARLLILCVLLGVCVAVWKKRNELTRDSATFRDMRQTQKMAAAVKEVLEPVTAPVAAAAGRVGGSVSSRAEASWDRRVQAGGTPHGGTVMAGRKGRRVEASTVSGLALKARRERAEAARKKRAAGSRVVTVAEKVAADNKATVSRQRRSGRRLRRADVTSTWMPSTGVNGGTANVAPARRAPTRRPRVKTAVAKTATVTAAPAAAMAVTTATKMRKVTSGKA